MTFYNKHLLDIKNSSVCETEEEVSFGRYNVIPVFGDWNCSRYPRGLSSVGGTNNKGELGG